MPIGFKEEIKGLIRYGLWDISESEEELLKDFELSANDQAYLQRIKHKRRRRQWLAGRHLIRELKQVPYFPSIEYSSGNKPAFQNSDLEFSVAHCRDMAAAAVSNVRVGVDVEHLEKKAWKLREKFLSIEELDLVNGNDKYEVATLCWSAKEALYKFWGHKKVQFNEELILHQFEFADKGVIPSEIIKDGYHFKLNVHYSLHGTYFFCYCMEEDAT